MPELELLPASYDLPGARLLDLVQVMDRIRAECPWSSRQTHEGLAKYGIEEAYELVEAIEEGDRDELREELGDVLLQVVFHARIAEEDAEEPFSVDDVAGGIVAKLIHRHPHVFGDETADDPRGGQGALAAHEGRREATRVRDRRRPARPARPGPRRQARLPRARTAGLDVPLPEPARASATSCSRWPPARRPRAWTRRRRCARRPGRYRDAIRAAEEGRSAARHRPEAAA